VNTLTWEIARQELENFFSEKPFLFSLLQALPAHWIEITACPLLNSISKRNYQLDLAKLRTLSERAQQFPHFIQRWTYLI
jgi:hypothetical protein